MEFDSVKTVVKAFIKHAADKEGVTVDSGWTTRQTYHYLLAYRNTILGKDLKNVSRSLYQVIKCLPFELIDQNECPCAAPSGLKFLRSLWPAPPSLKIDSVTSLIGNYTYNEVVWRNLVHKLNSRNKAVRERAYWSSQTQNIETNPYGEGEYIYLLNQEDSQIAKVVLLAEDPLVVQNFRDCKGNINPCFDPEEQTFMLDKKLLVVMYDMAAKQLKAGQERKLDVNNDGRDGTSENPITPIKS